MDLKVVMKFIICAFFVSCLTVQKGIAEENKVNNNTVCRGPIPLLKRRITPKRFPGLNINEKDSVLSPKEQSDGKNFDKKISELVERYVGVEFGGDEKAFQGMKGYSPENFKLEKDLKEKYQYFSKATVNFINGKICSVELKAEFDENQSDEFINNWCTNLLNTIEQFGENKLVNDNRIKNRISVRYPGSRFSIEINEYAVFHNGGQSIIVTTLDQCHRLKERPPRRGFERINESYCMKGREMVIKQLDLYETQSKLRFEQLRHVRARGLAEERKLGEQLPNISSSLLIDPGACLNSSAKPKVSPEDFAKNVSDFVKRHIGIKLDADDKAFEALKEYDRSSRKLRIQLQPKYQYFSRATVELIGNEARIIRLEAEFDEKYSDDSIDQWCVDVFTNTIESLGGSNGCVNVTRKGDLIWDELNLNIEYKETNCCLKMKEFAKLYCDGRPEVFESIHRCHLNHIKALKKGYSYKNDPRVYCTKCRELIISYKIHYPTPSEIELLRRLRKVREGKRSE